MRGLLIEPQDFKEHAKELPIFWGHGKEDPVVRYDLGVMSVEFLTKDLGVRQAPPYGTDATSLRGLSFNAYPNLGHSTTPGELDDVKSWLKKVLPIDSAVYTGRRG